MILSALSTEKKYVNISRTRIQKATAGTLQVRPMHKPQYDPDVAGNKLTKAPWEKKSDYPMQLVLFDERGGIRT